LPPPSHSVLWHLFMRLFTPHSRVSSSLSPAAVVGYVRAPEHGRVGPAAPLRRLHSRRLHRTQVRAAQGVLGAPKGEVRSRYMRGYLRSIDGGWVGCAGIPISCSSWSCGGGWSASSQDTRSTTSQNK